MTIALSALVAIMVVTISTADAINTARAQSDNTTKPSSTPMTASTAKIKGKPVGLTITLLGLNKIRGDIITYATIKNGTKNATEAVVYDAKELDLTDTQPDGIGKTHLFFENTFMHAGDKIKACYIVLETLNTHCNTLLKSPDFNTPEALTMSINSTKQG